MDTADLIRKAQQGDKQAEERLVIENSRLVWSVVMRFVNRGCEKEDLYQLGVIGLIKAIKRFDFGFDVKFSTYAVPMIIGEIKRFLRDDGIIKVSRSLKEQSAKVYTAKEMLEKQTGREATVSELAAMLELSAEQVIQALEVPHQIESLNRIIGDDGNTTIEDKHISDKNDGESIIESLALKLAIAQLDEREQQIVKLRYFLDKTQTEVAREIGISQVQVSRLEKRLLGKIRQKIV